MNNTEKLGFSEKEIWDYQVVMFENVRHKTPTVTKYRIFKNI